MAKVKVELTFPVELRDEPVIYNMGRNFKVIPTIIEASFSTQTGWALLILDGDEKEIERLLKYLRERNVIIDKRDM